MRFQIKIPFPGFSFDRGSCLCRLTGAEQCCPLQAALHPPVAPPPPPALHPQHPQPAAAGVSPLSTFEPSLREWWRRSNPRGISVRSILCQVGLIRFSPRSLGQLARYVLQGETVALLHQHRSLGWPLVDRKTASCSSSDHRAPHRGHWRARSAHVSTACRPPSCLQFTADDFFLLCFLQATFGKPPF